MSDLRIIERDRRDTLGEGPLWVASEDALYWVDILDRRVNRLSLADDAVTSVVMPELIGWVIERADRPGFIAGLASGFAELTLDPFQIRKIVTPEPLSPKVRMNDAKADRAGRIFAGTMCYEGAEPIGSLYRLDSDLSIAPVDQGYRIANGPAISDDGRTIYHTDSAEGLVYRMVLHSDGSLGAREVFLRFPDEWGSPDGMTMDAEGGLWIAHWGGSRVTRFLADGSIDRAIHVPALQVTSCTFAGPNLDRMFITSAADGLDGEHDGALFEVDPGVRGLPTLKFGG
ncbi:SMP-30/gluconolactonase/LRE family protein [Sphingomonas sp. MMS24-J13]|uniref:SMP-30/gluconolactonase/LRE family protein n=1 Tax=Sphingomonas sp. MMS24-J13 TaxID=3238686 RepID=UPI00384D520D